MKAMKGDKVTFDKCIKRQIAEGIVDAVYDKGTPNERYLVMDPMGIATIVSPKDINSSAIMLRQKKSVKPKVKKSRK